MATERTVRPRKKSTTTAGRTGANVARAPRGSRAVKPLTASASKASARSATEATRHAQQWQLDALAYYDQIGAVRYASEFRERALSRIRWFVGEKDDKGEIKPTTNEAAKQLLDDIQDPGGGRTVLMSTYAKLRFLNGECYLVWTKPPGVDEYQWEVLSILELRRGGDRGRKATYRRIAAPGLTPQDLIEAPDKDFAPMPNEAVVYRLWRRHPAYSMMADAPMRSVLADCEEIVRTTQTINARLISRLSGPGMLVMPESWRKRVQAAEAATQQGDNPRVDPFIEQLTDAMMAAIATPGSAESVVPICIWVPDETTDKAYLIKIWNPEEVIREVELREKALHRFAVGADMPPAKVEGIQDASHWNAWAIDKEGWEHVAPDAQGFADEIGGVYLRPAAREHPDIEDELAERLVVGYDPSEILVNPDSFEDALKLYDARAVGKKYLRNAGNAQDTDAMDDAELEEALFVATHQRVTVTEGALQEAEVIEDAEEDVPAAGDETDEDMPPEPVANPADDGLTASAYAIIGAAESEIERLRDVAGAKLRSYVQGNCPECVKEIKGVANGHVAWRLGTAKLEEIGAPAPLALVESTATSFAATATRWGVSSALAQALAEMLEIHAARTLHEEAPAHLPTGFASRLGRLPEAA